MSTTFGKNEHLKSSKQIAALFDSGSSQVKFPLKMFFDVSETEVTKVAFSVPKKNFASAVDRNRIKRQLREAYRLNKALVKSNNNGSFALLFLYISKEREAYASIDKAMRTLLQKLQ